MSKVFCSRKQQHQFGITSYWSCNLSKTHTHTHTHTHNTHTHIHNTHTHTHKHIPIHSLQEAARHSKVMSLSPLSNRLHPQQCHYKQNVGVNFCNTTHKHMYSIFYFNHHISLFSHHHYLLLCIIRSVHT